MSDDNTGRDAVDESPPGSEGQPVPLLEKIATAVSSLLIVGLIGVLVWDAVNPNAKPSFDVRAAQFALVSDYYRVPVTVRNLGDDAAKGVVLHVELLGPDTTVAESDITIDWLPGKSSKHVVGLFSNATTLHPTGVRAQVRGYQEP